MADETTTETTDEATEKAPKAPIDPFSKEPSSTHESLARYINNNAPEDAHITPRQAQSVLVLHGKWQGSDERKAEREEELRQKAEEAEAKAKEREAKKAEREAEKARKAEEKKAKEAAKKAADEGSDSDLDALESGESEGTDGGQTPRRRKRRAAATAEV